MCVLAVELTVDGWWLELWWLLRGDLGNVAGCWWMDLRLCNKHIGLASVCIKR